MQKDAVKEEKLEKERRKVLKEKKRAKEGQRERETEVLGEKEKDKEVLHKSDSGFHIKRFQSNLNYYYTFITFQLVKSCNKEIK